MSTKRLKSNQEAEIFNKLIKILDSTDYKTIKYDRVPLNWEIPFPFLPLLLNQNIPPLLSHLYYRQKK